MKNLTDVLAGLSVTGNGASYGDRLSDLPEFGGNPGNLRARTYFPAELPANAALVVVLHGCTQTAARYDAGAGWSELADRHGFALLLPEQRRENNPNLCFNWFQPDDIKRGSGEAESIRVMILRLMADRNIDPARIFITGLSAGGAMSVVMLACYPELFAGGAVIAGLPYGCAAGVPQAMTLMRGQNIPGARDLQTRLRGASAHHGRWPTLSVWQGDADAVVGPANAEAIVAQWRAVHALAEVPNAIERIDGHTRSVWRDTSGRDVIEAYRIGGMGHGTPLATKGSDACGAVGPHMLEAGISSTRHIARFWGLTDTQTRAAAKPAIFADPIMPDSTIVLRTIRLKPERIPEPRPATAGGVGKVIEDALRAAGLMR